MSVEQDEAKPGGSSDRNDFLRLSNTTAATEIRRRGPWMIVGLVAGIAMIAIGRHFEEALAAKIELTFFIPMIVYMSDIIGAETMALFIRELALSRVQLHRFLLREASVGVALGLITGVPMGIVCLLWLKDEALALTVTIAMSANGLVAVLTGMTMPILFDKLKRDPALGTDEITTAVSDTISILIYLATATLIIFS